MGFSNKKQYILKLFPITRSLDHSITRSLDHSFYFPSIIFIELNTSTDAEFPKYSKPLFYAIPHSAIHAGLRE